ncbi:MAG: Rieske (2Fe-2S) protein [Acidobacteriota bacterium]
MTNWMARRSVLKGGLGLGICLNLAAADILGQDDPAALRPKQGDLLVKENDAAKVPLTPGDLAIGAAQTMAWAMDPGDRTVRSASRLNRVLLIRLDAGKLDPETMARAADGVVAYTAICTHTGCEVVEWLADEGTLHCPCHFSKFNPGAGARVVDGPAPRPLPALPLELMDGRLVVAKPFTSRVGFETA